MPPIVDLDFFDLPVYSAFVMLGVLLGLSVAYLSLYVRARSQRTASLPAFLNVTLVVLIAGWIGARAYHVATHGDYYSMRPEEIAQVGLGGFAIRGALLVGVVALALYARVRGLRFARLADAAALGLSAGQAIGWVGALARGANYGVVSDIQLAMDLPDIYGLYAPRFPLPYAEILLFAGLFVCLLALAMRNPRAGTLGVIYLLMASAANFALGFQRGDAAAFVSGLRVDQWVDATMAGAALLFFVMARREGNVGIKW